MEVDYRQIWAVRPIWLPGQVKNYLPSGIGGFILVKIDLHYPDGESFEEIYYYKLEQEHELYIGSKVLFTMKPAKIKERQKIDRRSGKSQPEKMEVDEIRPATEAEIEEAIKEFKGNLIILAIEKANQAEMCARELERLAQEKVDQYSDQINEVENRIRQLNHEVEEKVNRQIAHEKEQLSTNRNNLESERLEIEKRETELQRQELEIASYKKAITLYREEPVLTTDSEFPKNLATIWPGLLRTSGLTFSRDIATAFLLSVMASAYSGSIVLLNGPVGVGKTSLVNQFAKALGGICNIIPVRPAWIDPSDLVGFFDPINNTFRPTPFITALRANVGDRLKLVCLDELNLARIENYAADLLSCIEYSRSYGARAQEDNDAGDLKLYSKDIQQQLWEEAIEIVESGDQATPQELRRRRVIETLINHYPSQSPFPANTVLIGTLNSDETTYDLSPKMIDRSYVVTFPPASLDSVKKKPKEEYAKQQIAVTELLNKINTAYNLPTKYWDTVVRWNEELHRFGIPLGYRVKRDYDVFRATGSVLGVSERDCLGYFLFCKILPRIFFFKEQSNTEAIKPEVRCKAWLEMLKQEYKDFGPIYVIDAMIKMCEDERVPSVRYWSKS